MKEIWKPIEGFEDYQISNHGRIKSYWYGKENVLKPSKNKHGYFTISLCIRKIHSTKMVHRLVAETFLHNSNKPQVNHKDGNKLNNYSSNLEWVTNSENMKHAYKNGLHSQKGMNHAQCILSDNEVLSIHGLYLSGMTQLEIAKMYNVSRQNITSITNGIIWKHLYEIMEMK